MNAQVHEMLFFFDGGLQLAPPTAALRIRSHFSVNAHSNVVQMSFVRIRLFFHLVVGPNPQPGLQATAVPFILTDVTAVPIGQKKRSAERGKISACK